MILIGDVLDMLATLPANHVDCVVTSPPYWGLRDYGVDGQLGLEVTPAAYVGHMRMVFEQVRRVLKPEGTLWLNLGDSYSYSTSGSFKASDKQASNRGSVEAKKIKSTLKSGLSAKNLCGIPWRVAFALQKDGWILRQEIIWAKSRVMPMGLKDRFLTAHEQIFLLSKGSKYFFDQEAVKEPASAESAKRYAREFRDVHSGSTKHMRIAGEICPRQGPSRNISAPTHRIRRTVWTVAPAQFKGAHFATFPPKLIEPCILAGCPAGGTVLDPFFGAGTVGVVAKEHGRKWIGIEINPAYAEMARAWIGA